MRIELKSERISQIVVSSDIVSTGFMIVYYNGLVSVKQATVCAHCILALYFYRTISHPRDVVANLPVPCFIQSTSV